MAATAGASSPICVLRKASQAERPDGALPFVLPVSTLAGTAPWRADGDPLRSSPQITPAVCAVAARAARQDQAVASHRWLERATDYCLSAIEAMHEEPPAHILMYSVQVLDAVYETRPGAAGLLKRLGEYIPANGVVRVAGGTEEEALRPLDFAPSPGRPARTLFGSSIIDAELDRLTAMQQADGGWTVDYPQISPVGTLEWRGYATVRAVQILRANSRA
jgi:hypothetical protein